MYVVVHSSRRQGRLHSTKRRSKCAGSSLSFEVNEYCGSER